MVPLGISSATAVLWTRTGPRRTPSCDSHGMERPGLRHGLHGALRHHPSFSSTFIIDFYTTDPEVKRLSRDIILIAALFQLPTEPRPSPQAPSEAWRHARTDARQLDRALGRRAFQSESIFAFATALATAWASRFLWIGLSVGLTSVALLLLVRWIRLSRSHLRALTESPVANSSLTS